MNNFADRFNSSEFMKVQPNTCHPLAEVYEKASAYISEEKSLRSAIYEEVWGERNETFQAYLKGAIKKQKKNRKLEAAKTLPSLATDGNTLMGEASQADGPTDGLKKPARINLNKLTSTKKRVVKKKKPADEKKPQAKQQQQSRPPPPHPSGSPLSSDTKGLWEQWGVDQLTYLDNDDRWPEAVRKSLPQDLKEDYLDLARKMVIHTQVSTLLLYKDDSGDSDNEIL